MLRTFDGGTAMGFTTVDGEGSGLLDFLTSEGSLYHFFLSYLSLKYSLNDLSSLVLGSLSLDGFQ